MQNYPIKFKAALLKNIHKPLVIEEVEFRGPLLEGQILVKLEYSGICGRQIDEIDGNCGEDKFLPHLLGHEGSGEVIDIGPGITKVIKGNKVILHWMKGTGIESETPKYFCNNKQINAGWVTTFNEYAVVSENRVTVTPDPSEMQLSALCGCVITTSTGVVNQAKISASDSVLVYGCGGIGLCVIQAASFFKPKEIIAIDINQKSLELAKEFGATNLIDAQKEDILKSVLEITEGRGANKVIVCIGNTQAIELAHKCTAVPGNCYLIGIPPVGETITVNANDIMHEKNILGSLGGGINPDLDIPLCFSMQKTGDIDFKRLITHVDSFVNINESIDRVRKGDGGRCILKF